MFDDGAEVTVWPDGRTSAQARARAIKAALEWDDHVPTVVGGLVMIGCTKVEWRLPAGQSGDLEADLDLDVPRLHVGHVPARKRPALYTANPFDVLAYFVSEEAAMAAEELIG